MDFAGIKCAAFVTPALVPGSPYTELVTEHIT